MSPRVLLALAALALAASACSRPFVPATPPGFVDLGDRFGRNEYRAMTADGVVIGVRAYDNDPKGELAFWARALERRLHDMGAYALLDKREVKGRTGLAGVQFRMGHDEGKVPHIYYVTLFVTDDRIFLLEAGGTKPEMERMAPQIDWSVKNFLPK
jgi:hypothetical protein